MYHNAFMILYYVHLYEWKWGLRLHWAWGFVRSWSLVLGRFFQGSRDVLTSMRVYWKGGSWSWVVGCPPPKESTFIVPMCKKPTNMMEFDDGIFLESCESNQEIIGMNPKCFPSTKTPHRSHHTDPNNTTQAEHPSRVGKNPSVEDMQSFYGAAVTKSVLSNGHGGSHEVPNFTTGGSHSSTIKTGALAAHQESQGVKDGFGKIDSRFWIVFQKIAGPGWTKWSWHGFEVTFFSLGWSRSFFFDKEGSDLNLMNSYFLTKNS